MDRPSELALVRRLKTGDPTAFDVVYAAFNDRLFTFLVRLSRRRDVAEDLLEDTWLRLVTRAASLRDDTQLLPWLFTVARNLYYSYCRSRLLETSAGLDSAGLWPAQLSCPSPFEATAASELERRLESALAELPAIYREVLLLVGVGGLSPADAATVCGVTPETLRQRLHRARGLLADRLDDARGLAVMVKGEVAT